MNKLVTQLIVQVLTVLVVAAVVALWSYYQLIALVTLLAIVGWLGIEGYARVRTIRQSGVEGRFLRNNVRDEEWGSSANPLDESIAPSRGVGPLISVESQYSNPGARGRRNSADSNRPANFSGLLKSGRLSAGNKVLLGLDGTGQPVYGDATTTGLAGKTGGGKTVTTSFIMGQRIAQTQGDVRFIVVDPHMYVNSHDTLFHVSEPLTAFFLTIEEIRSTVDQHDYEYLHYLEWMEHSKITNPNSGGEMLKAWAGLVDLEFERRLHGKTGPLWLWIIDEFNGQMEVDDIAAAIVPVMGRIGRQARKMDMQALLIAQVWTADTIGGKTALRKSIAQFVTHRLNESDASLIIPAQYAKHAPMLPVGVALVYTTGGDVLRLSIPYTTELDLVQLAAAYSPSFDYYIEEEETVEATTINNQRTEEIGQASEAPLLLAPVERASERTNQQPEKPAPKRLSYNPVELQQVKEFYEQGLTEQNIAKLVFGVKSGGELQRAQIKVRDMIKALME